MDPFVGEIRLMSFNFAPKGWAFCDGTILQIRQNQALFALIGNAYGGDGQQTFALPDLRGRVPLALNFSLGEPLASKGGSETVTLTVGQLPPHNHMVTATTTAGDNRSGTNTILSTAPFPVYVSSQTGNVPLNPGSVTNTGAGEGHPNMQPFLVLNFCIALTGLYPPRN